MYRTLGIIDNFLHVLCRCSGNGKQVIDREVRSVEGLEQVKACALYLGGGQNIGKCSKGHELLNSGYLIGTRCKAFG